MTQRLHYFKVSSKLFGKLYDLSQALHNESLDPELFELVHMLASIRNGCGFCLDASVKKAKIQGISSLRVHHVPVWRESNLFNDREKAAFEWTEALTRLPESGISDDLYDRVRGYFSEKEITDLTFAIATINVWNRMNAAFKTVPGSLDEMLGLTQAGMDS